VGSDVRIQLITYFIKQHIVAIYSNSFMWYLTKSIVYYTISEIYYTGAMK
jgi:hypothetical protein